MLIYTTRIALFMRYLIGNWKSNHTIRETQDWLSEFVSLKPRIHPHLKIVLAIPFTDLAEANRLISHHNLNLHLAAQDVSQFQEGKHTGEVSARMLSELTKFCLIGHSERRREFKETSEIVSQKAARLLEENLTPIICLDTPYLEEQIKFLLKDRLPLEHCLFVYEPLAAIGTGKPADPFEVELTAQKISFLTESRCPVLYGGSVNPENVTKFVIDAKLDGVLVGGESLIAKNFYQLLTNLSYEL